MQRTLRRRHRGGTSRGPAVSREGTALAPGVAEAPDARRGGPSLEGEALLAFPTGSPVQCIERVDFGLTPFMGVPSITRTLRFKSRYLSKSSIH